MIPGAVQPLVTGRPKPVITTLHSSSVSVDGNRDVFVNFGSVVPHRWIIPIVSAYGSFETISGVTVGGVAASGDASASTSTVGSGAHGRCGIYRAQPPGENGNINIALSAREGSQTATVALFVLSVVNLDLSTRHDRTTKQSGFGGFPISDTINVRTDGFVIGAAIQTMDGAFAWTGITESHDNTFDTDKRKSHAFDTRMKAEAGRTISVDVTGNVGNGTMEIQSF